MKNSMEIISKFIKNNIFPIIIGLFFYSGYLYFTYSGNRICDCESTEKYSSSQSGHRSSVNRFYHK